MFALIHDVGDCAISLLYCDESKTGPTEIVIVLPPSRRDQLRTDFGFEALAFMTFLRAVPKGAELTLHDGINAAVKEGPADASLVFAIGTGVWPADCDFVLSQCAEDLAAATIDWLSR
ncbi:MAG: hypothetical protein JSU00_12540 [Acidobacteria bacterium]|nr:hypothetical protein [Acidobacteriota bacterium]